MSGRSRVVVLIVLALAYGVWMVMRESRRGGEDEHRPERPEASTLAYALPTGQDPAVVLGALRRHGITGTVVPSPHQQLIHIDLPPDRPQPREQVREILSTTTSTAIEHGAAVQHGAVRFLDEE